MTWLTENDIMKSGNTIRESFELGLSASYRATRQPKFKRFFYDFTTPDSTTDKRCDGRTPGLYGTKTI